MPYLNFRPRVDNYLNKRAVLLALVLYGLSSRFVVRESGTPIVCWIERARVQLDLDFPRHPTVFRASVLIRWCDQKATLISTTGPTGSKGAVIGQLARVVGIERMSFLDDAPTAATEVAIQYVVGIELVLRMRHPRSQTNATGL